MDAFFQHHTLLPQLFYFPKLFTHLTSFGYPVFQAISVILSLGLCPAMLTPSKPCELGFLIQYYILYTSRVAEQIWKVLEYKIYVVIVLFFCFFYFSKNRINQSLFKLLRFLLLSSSHTPVFPSFGPERRGDNCGKQISL